MQVDISLVIMAKRGGSTLLFVTDILRKSNIFYRGISIGITVKNAFEQ